MSELKRILVVDDEPSFRATLSTQLKGEGYGVLSAGDGDIAIEMLRSEKFDLILLDLKMPTVDGYGVLSFVREQHPATKVIVLTGFADLRNTLDSKGLGADLIVGKPFEFEDLLSNVHRLLKDR
jgi:DNA-binding response OmpR family regulator